MPRVLVESIVQLVPFHFMPTNGDVLRSISNVYATKYIYLLNLIGMQNNFDF